MSLPGDMSEPSVEEILASIKKVIARDTGGGAPNLREQREPLQFSRPEPVDEADDVLELGSAAELDDPVHDRVHRMDAPHDEVERAASYENLRLPDELNYADVPALSHEVRQRLTRHRPATLGQASRISGVTPAAISLLLVHLKKGRYKGFAQPVSGEAA